MPLQPALISRSRGRGNPDARSRTLAAAAKRIICRRNLHPRYTFAAFVIASTRVRSGRPQSTQGDMEVLSNVVIISLTVCIMEVVAWSTHKYVMHSWAWRWHSSHHDKQSQVVEKNDYFSVIFAIVSLTLILSSDWFGKWLFWAGIGMAVYGVMYVIVHDGLTHGRIPMAWTPRHRYVQHLINAHHLHHAKKGRTGHVSYGFLYAPPMNRLRRQMRKRSSKQQ
jgi:beta-carotene 3-hydroxylase